MQRATFLNASITGLNPGEVRATGVADLCATHRAALLAISIAGLAKPKGRVWIAGGHPDLITDKTITALRKRGLVGGATRSPSGVTDKGRWYVRTIVNDIANENISEEAPLCPVIE